MPDRVDVATDQIIAAVDGAMGWIVLNNPEKHNAISSAMFAGIGAAIAHFKANDAVRVIVIRGAGEKAFAAGADLEDLPVDGFPRGAGRQCCPCNKPIIAMIHGWCLGGGVMTALCADIRVAADDAVFSIPAARLGVGYPLEGVMRLVEVAGARPLATCYSPANAWVRFGPKPSAWCNVSLRPTSFTAASSTWLAS